MFRLVLLALVAVLAGLCDARRMSNGMVRIVPSGSSPYRGRLEVLYYGRWGTVCNDHFTHWSADVACRQLGLPGGWRIGRYNHEGLCHNLDGRYMCGRGHIWLDDVHCHGWERRISDCPRLPWGWHDCGHHEDVMIQCMSPPLWNIEWGFEDEKDKTAFVSGVNAYYVLAMKRTATPNMFLKCWPMWKAQEKLKIAIYTDDTLEKENPANLKVSQMHWSWLYGFLQKPWATPYVHFTVNSAHCDMERIRAIQCDKEYEIPPDVQRSYCWESHPRIPDGYTLLQQGAPDIGYGHRNFSELANVIASDMVTSIHMDSEIENILSGRWQF